MIKSFNVFILKHNLKKSNIKYKNSKYPFFLALSDVGIYLRDEPFSSDLGIVNLEPTQGKKWVSNNNQNYFNSYGCSPRQNLSKFVLKKNGKCLYSEYEIQGLTSKKDSYCAAFC